MRKEPRGHTKCTSPPDSLSSNHTSHWPADPSHGLYLRCDGPARAVLGILVRSGHLGNETRTCSRTFHTTTLPAPEPSTPSPLLCPLCHLCWGVTWWGCLTGMSSRMRWWGSDWAWCEYKQACQRTTLNSTHIHTVTFSHLARRCGSTLQCRNNWCILAVGHDTHSDRQDIMCSLSISPLLSLSSLSLPLSLLLSLLLSLSSSLSLLLSLLSLSSSFLLLSLSLSLSLPLSLSNLHIPPLQLPAQHPHWYSSFITWLKETQMLFSTTTTNLWFGTQVGIDSVIEGYQDDLHVIRAQ